MSTEAMKLALDALTESVDLVQNEYDSNWRHGVPTRAAQLAAEKSALDAHKAAIEALRRALSAQPPAPSVPPVRERLTETQIDSASPVRIESAHWFKLGARWAERALIGGEG